VKRPDYTEWALRAGCAAALFLLLSACLAAVVGLWRFIL